MHCVRSIYFYGTISSHTFIVGINFKLISFTPIASPKKKVLTDRYTDRQADCQTDKRLSYKEPVFSCCGTTLKIFSHAVVQYLSRFDKSLEFKVSCGVKNTFNSFGRIGGS